MYQNKKGNQTTLLRAEKEKRRKRRRRQRNARICILTAFVMVAIAIAVHMAGNGIPLSDMSHLITNNSEAEPQKTKIGVQENGVSNTAKGHTESDTGIKLAAANAYVMNASTGEVLFEKNSNTKIAPASTTKLITALTAMQYCKMDDMVTIGKEVKMIASDSSKAWLLPGEKMTVRQLMIAMLLPSGNDAAYAVAAYTGRKIAKDNSLGYKEAVSVFIKEMNETAKEVSAEHSNFCSPDGYDCEGQEVTARDMAEIGKAVVASKELTSITGMKESHEVWKTGETGDYTNTNLLLDKNSEYYNQDTIGLKTGSSDAAGCCLVSAFEISGEDYIVVVMGSTEEGRWEDTSKLYNEIVNGKLL